MAKPVLKRVLEPSTGLVHYHPGPLCDQVTLCGHTDWLGEQHGKDTRAAATCAVCISIVRHIHDHADPEAVPERRTPKRWPAGTSDEPLIPSSAPERARTFRDKKGDVVVTFDDGPGRPRAQVCYLRNGTTRQHQMPRVTFFSRFSRA